MKNTLKLISLVVAVSSLALAQNVTVKTSRGTLNVNRAGNTLQVDSNTSKGRKNVTVEQAGNATDVQANGAAVRVETDQAPAPAPAASDDELVAGVQALAARSDNAWTVDGQRKRLAHACTPNEDVSISGQHNAITLTGPCGFVQVSGQHNAVSVEQAQSIDTSGMNNQVTWRNGPARQCPAGVRGPCFDQPRLSTSGFDNQVARSQ